MYVPAPLEGELLPAGVRREGQIQTAAMLAMHRVERRDLPGRAFVSLLGLLFDHVADFWSTLHDGR